MTKNNAALSAATPINPNSVPGAASGAVSGAGMDRKVTTNTNPMKKWLLIVSVISIVIVAVTMIAGKSTGKVLSVDNSRIVVSKVTSGVFEDFIPIRGRVTPAKTVY